MFVYFVLLLLEAFGSCADVNFDPRIVITPFGEPDLVLMLRGSIWRIWCIRESRWAIHLIRGGLLAIDL